VNDLKYAQERAGILATGVGLARWALQNGEPAEALEHLDRAARQTHELLRDALIESGADPEKVDLFLGRAFILGEPP
jgi:hypothetical protein